MAGPSVWVKFLGDTQALVDAVKNVGGAGATAASKMGDAFHGVLGALNQSGVLGPFGTALDGVDRAIQAIGDHSKGVGVAMMGVGTAVAGIGVGLSALGSKDQAAHQQLQASVEATGKDYDDYAERVEKAIKSQEKYGSSAHETQDALRILTQAMNDPAKALDALGTASDLAAAKHESLGTAATQLGRAYNGATKIFKEFGINAKAAGDATKELDKATKEASSSADAAEKAHQKLADVQEVLKGKTTLTVAEQIRLRDAQQAVVDADAKAKAAHDRMTIAQQKVTNATKDHTTSVDQLGKKLSGQAAAAADTFNGHLKAMKTRLEDAAAAFGQKYGPAITITGTAMAGLGGIMQAAPGIIGLVSAAWDVLTAAEYASMLPYVLIVAGIALIGVAIYELVTHWSAVWGAMKEAVEFVWNWIKDHWPLLVAILLGPIGIAVDLIIKNFDTIRDFVVGVWDAIYRALEPFVAAVVGAFVWLAKLIADVAYAMSIPWQIAFQIIYALSNAAANLVIGVFQWLWNVIATIAGALAAPFAAAWNAVFAAVSFVIGAIAGAWNSLIGWFAGVAGSIANILAGPFHVVVGVVGTIGEDIKGVWNNLIGWFGGLATRMAGVFGTVWGTIGDTFRAVINWIIDLWNRLHFTLPKVDFLGQHIGGESIGVPPIPHLAAGGLMTSDGLVFAHAGEVISPAPAAATGPRVVIENVNVSDGADVALLLGKLRFATMAGRL